MLYCSICLSTLFGQIDTSKMIYFKTLPRLEVVNEQIYQLLDSLILYNEDCVYTIHGKPYCFYVILNKKGGDTINIKLESNQYDNIWLESYANWIGCFYYKNILVGVDSSDIVSLFFKKTSDMQDIYYEKSILYFRPYGKGYEFMYIKYDYINNLFIPIDKYLCQESSPYYHKIKEGETWEKITEDYGITIEDLIAKNKRIKIKKPPKKGISVRVY